MNTQYRRQIKQKLIIKQGNKCAYCGCDFDLNDKYKTPTLDHIIPKVKVGDKTDFVVCCARCNKLKSDIPIELYLNGYIGCNIKYNYDGNSINIPLKVRNKIKWYNKIFPKIFPYNLDIKYPTYIRLYEI